MLSVMHEPQPPRAADGKEFYDSIVRFGDGIAVKMPLSKRGARTSKSWLRRESRRSRGQFLDLIIGLDCRRTPSNTPHPTSLRSATFSHKGRRGASLPPSQIVKVRDLRRRQRALCPLPLWEKVAERSEVG